MIDNNQISGIMVSAPRILVVEDEAITAADIEHILQKLGYEIAAVSSSAEQAVQKARELEPDLILMDICLSGDVDGISAALEIHKNQNVPIIFLTAYTDDETIQRAKKSTPYGYILKPFSEKDLYSAIETALYKFKTERHIVEREQWVSTILRSIGEAVIVTDQNGLITFINGSAEHLTMWTMNDAIGKPLSDVFRLDKEYMKGASGAGSQNSSKLLASTDAVLIPQTGSHFFIDYTVTSILDDLGKNAGGVIVFRDITERKIAEAEIRKSIEMLRKAMGGAIQAIALTVETRDPYTAGHQRRVTNLARAIAEEMNLTADQKDAIRMAGVIHDLGKISVPAEILSKPGAISNLEFGLIKTHPQVGYDILKTIEFPWPVAQIVYQHHERMDGSGYPNGILGADMLIESRIISVADVVEAMASHRPYRASLGIGAALEEITNNRIRLYDADVVDACVAVVSREAFSF